MNSFSPPQPSVLRYYARFLETYSWDRAKSWARNCHSDLEAASCEAYSWALLSALGVSVTPNLDVNAVGKSVDFHCNSNGREFLAEVTCLSRENVTRCTGLTDDFDGEVHSHWVITKAIQRECRSKATQCAGWGVPTLLMVGTFHQQGSIQIRPEYPAMDWVLTGETRITYPLDSDRHRFHDEAFLTSEGKDAAFIDDQMQAARQSISALLIVGFGIVPPSIVGLTHIEAARAFDEQAIPNVPFGRLLLDRSTNQLGVQWTKP